MLFQSFGSSLGISYGHASPKAVQVIAGQLVSKLRSVSRNRYGRIKQTRIVVKDCLFDVYLTSLLVKDLWLSQRYIRSSKSSVILRRVSENPAASSCKVSEF